MLLGTPQSSLLSPPQRTHQPSSRHLSPPEDLLFFNPPQDSSALQRAHQPFKSWKWLDQRSVPKAPQLSVAEVSRQRRLCDKNQTMYPQTCCLPPPSALCFANTLRSVCMIRPGSGQNIVKQNDESQNIERKISKAKYRRQNIEVAKCQKQNIEVAKYRKTKYRKSCRFASE